MARTFIVGLVLLLIVGLIVSFVVWGDQIKQKINEWQNGRNPFVAQEQTITTTQVGSNATDETAGWIDLSPNNTSSITNDVESTSDDRTLLTAENIYEINKKYGCTVEFNVDAPNETVTYNNNSIIFEVPFNEKWGTDKYRLLPYEEDGGVVHFGRMYGFEACVWVRESQMSIEPSRSAKAAQESYLKAGLSEDKLVITKIEGYEAVKIFDSGLCEHPSIELIGPDHNYIFSVTCSVDAKKDMRELEDIITTVNFPGRMLGMK